MENAIGFFGFEIDGDVKLANIESNYESFAPYYLDWVREANHEDLLRTVSTLTTVPVGSNRDTIAQAFGYDNAEEFSEKVGSFPEGVLGEASNKPKDMLYNGVVYGTTTPSDFHFAEYGYVVNLTNGTLDCYIGNQLSSHDEGLFFAVEPNKEVGSGAHHYGLQEILVFAPRLYASYEWDRLPSKSDFLANHYRALVMQEDINKATLSSVKEKKSNSFINKFRRNHTVRDDVVCGGRIKSNGQTCVLRASHGGNHRSRI